MLQLFRQNQKGNVQTQPQQSEAVISSIQSWRDRPLPAGRYDRRSTGISVDFVYRPADYTERMVQGGYGKPYPGDVAWDSLEEIVECIDEYLGVTVMGTEAGCCYAKRLIHHFENYGFGNGFMFEATKEIAIIPMTDVRGLGQCPGPLTLISPCDWHEDVDTLAHEYYHNIGEKHDTPNGSCKDHPVDQATDEIYIKAAKVARYLAQFPAP